MANGSSDFFVHHADLLFNTLLAASSSLIIILDGDFRVISLNPAAVQILADDNEPMLGESVFSLFSTQDQEVLSAHLTVMKQSQQPHHFQYVIDERLFTATLQPVFTPEEQLLAVVMVADDNTELKRMEDDLFLANQILSTVQHPMAILDDQERFKRFNDAFISVFSPDQNALEQIPLKEVMGEENYAAIIGPLLEKTKQGNSVESQNWYSLPYQGLRFLRIHIYPLFSGRLTISGMVLHFMDLTEMKRMEEALHKLSITDVLTGLFNRNHFQTISEAEMSRSARYGIPLAFIMFDIDHFKRINDQYGHDKGDLVLKAISAQVHKQIRDTDLLFRWGGEEFILLLPHTTCDEAVVLAERIRMGIEHAHFEPVGTVTCSFGVTAYHGRENGQQLFGRLDELLYESKKRGRNRVTAE